MKIALTIDTTEPFTSFSNLESMIQMSVEELGENRYAWGQPFTEKKELSTRTRYRGSDELKHIAKINLSINR